MIAWFAHQLRMAFCNHTLKLVSTTDIYAYANQKRVSELPVAFERVMICDKCGFKKTNRY